MTIELNGEFVNDRSGNLDSALYLNHGYGKFPSGVYYIKIF